jgi:hypothetical protein
VFVEALREATAIGNSDREMAGKPLTFSNALDTIDSRIDRRSEKQVDFQKVL